MTADRPKITSWPIGWPSDGRSRITSFRGDVILVHPERTPHVYDEKTSKWKEIEPCLTDQVILTFPRV